MNLTRDIKSLVILAILGTSCNHYDSIQKSGEESTAAKKSHNAGEDCMSCHHDPKNEAAEEGKWFYFAGTVYNKNNVPAYSGGRVELWTGISANALATGHMDNASLTSGKKLYSVPIDKSGNFYTGKIVDFKSGFFPRLVANDNSDTLMNISTNVGSCNSCHGHNADGTNQVPIRF